MFTRATGDYRFHPRMTLGDVLDIVGLFASLYLVLCVFSAVAR